MSEAGRFLDAVDDHLPLVADTRVEVIDELADHIEVSALELESGGMEPYDAERTAIARMGAPAELARDIGAARKGQRRLLPAVGYATASAAWAVWIGWIAGGAVVVGVAGVILGMLVILTSWQVAPWSALDGVGTIVRVVLPSFLAFLIGRMAPYRLARRADRSLGWARWVTLLLGIPVTLALVLLTGWSDINTWTMAGQLVTPLFLVLGVAVSADAERPIVRRRDLEALATVTIGLAVAAVVALPSWLTVDSRVDQWDETLMGPTAALGPVQVRGATRLAFALPLNGRQAFLRVSRSLPRHYSDPRVELWAAEASGQRLDASSTVPLMTIPLVQAVWDGSVEVGAWLDPHRLQDWPPTWSVLVATDGQGRRVVLDYRPNGRDLMYRGTGIDWLLGR